MAAILRGGFVGSGESSAGFIAVIFFFDRTSLPRTPYKPNRRMP
jgi:hypothetical protein